MKLFFRIFAILVLSIFGLFLISPVFAINNSSQNSVIISSNFTDICTTNIQCEVLLNGQYFCHSNGEGISNQGSSISHIPTGKNGTQYITYCGNGFVQSKEIIGHKTITYIEPDPYIYPFVGISKIQV